MDRRHLNFFISGCICILICLSSIRCHILSSASKDRTPLESLHFTLPDGKSLDTKFWREGKSIIYFGFSHCPDMCPLALHQFARASLILGPLAKEFRFIFITLDPERDSPALLANYVHQFPGKSLHAFSPSNESLMEIENIFQLTRKQVMIGKSYTIDHSNLIYVLDEKLQQIKAYPGGISSVELANQLRNLSKSN